ncbi:MAG: hypothetical protein SOZ65_07195, partial [Erysipelotrichaceae bacterium]|nr:hypothetical protein [Erysipelotrichaceae bacterium]
LTLDPKLFWRCLFFISSKIISLRCFFFDSISFQYLTYLADRIEEKMIDFINKSSYNLLTPEYLIIKTADYLTNLMSLIAGFIVR